jgi:hypothetical protein
MGMIASMFWKRIAQIMSAEPHLAISRRFSTFFFADRDVRAG